MYKYLLPAADLLISSLHIFLLAFPKNQNQESHGSAFSGSGSLLKNTTGTMYGLAALSKTSTIAVMIKLTRTLSHAALRRSVGRLSMKSSTGTAALFLIHKLLVRDSPQSSFRRLMIGEPVVFPKYSDQYREVVWLRPCSGQDMKADSICSMLLLC